MIVADVFLEPNEQLWAAIPFFLLALLVLDLSALRPGWGGFGTVPVRPAWKAGLLLTGLGAVLLWMGSRALPGTTWWYPAWTVILLWGVAAREVCWWALRSQRLVACWVGAIGCAFGLGISLVMLGRSSDPAGKGLLVGALLAIVILTGLWSRRFYRPPLGVPGVPQRLGPVLRVMAVTLLAVILLNPVVRHTQVRYDRACLLVLLDDSRSMTIRDVVQSDPTQPISRAGALNTALTAHRYELERIGQKMDILAYRFADQAVAAEQMSVRAQGNYTAIGDAIQQVYESALQTGRPVAGVLIFSDGASNLSVAAEPQVVASALAAGHVPLWAVGIGSETPSGQTRTVIPRNLLMAGRVAAMNEMPITAEFGFVGLQGEPVRVELLLDDDVVDRQRLACASAHETRQVRFLFAPQVGGLHKVTVRAAPERFKLDGPPAEISQFLHVADEAIRVLYIEGKPRYEGSFLVRALAGSQQIRLHKTLLAPPGDENLRTVPGGPAGEWRQYHVILLGDMSPGQLTYAQMVLLQQHVGDAGCGLAILAGRGLVGTGGLAGTPLADLLPVGADTGWVDQAVSVIPTEAGLNHPLCRIDEVPQDVPARWRSLPPVRGVCRLTGLKPAAQVLATSPEGQPIIVAHAFGAGRVILIGFDSTWQWCMLRDEGKTYHKRFWREVVLWLANRRPTVWIAAERPRYQRPLLAAGQQRVEIRAGWDHPIAGQAIEGARLEAKMIQPDGQGIPLVMVPDGEQYTAHVEPKADGTYKLELTARSGDREIGAAEGRFIVESPDLEMIRQLADFDLLRSMASRTEAAGGRFVPLDGMSELLRMLGTDDYRRRHEETLTHQLSHEGRWRLWALFCGLLLAEWIIRKRRGLV